MIISCDGNVTQPGIFEDELRTDNVDDKCDQSRDEDATMYVVFKRESVRILLSSLLSIESFFVSVTYVTQIATISLTHSYHK